MKCLLGAFALFVGHSPDDAGGAEIAYLFANVLQAEGNNLVRGGMLLALVVASQLAIGALSLVPAGRLGGG